MNGIIGKEVYIKLDDGTIPKSIIYIVTGFNLGNRTAGVARKENNLEGYERRSEFRVSFSNLVFVN